MAHINSIGQGAMEPLDRAAGAAAYHSAQKPRSDGQRAADRVELSAHARMFERLLQLPEVRSDLVASVRQAISDGTYLTDEKLGIAADRLLDEL